MVMEQGNTKNKEKPFHLSVLITKNFWQYIDRFQRIQTCQWQNK